ncbi:putative membrane protein [Anaerosolibacter carboniphilus]|uniref:Putative membrane protein n=1 Tax=Anaerosolibacter carboniphilus TaxID=1417629 RepID=A0A841KYQ6_9FIRM|nr:phage holin family protein [Anaerosolibacter carboniphilus]MBB6216032.1 putative membrane protein [Anaerosolibacter carboniphilus]
MTKFLLRWIASAASIYITAALFENIYITGFAAAMIAAVILGIANMIVKPIIIVFTLPINILTLGLFTLVINGIVLKMTAGFVGGFMIDGLTTAILASIVLSIVHMLLSGILGVKKD